MRKKKITMRLAVIMVALLVLCIQAGDAWSWFGGSKKKTAEGMMPHFELSSALKGPVFNSDELQGNVVLVNFWATWCGPCVDEYPDLIRLHKTFAGRKFSVIGISEDNSKSKVREFVEKYGHAYPMLMASSGVTRDFGAGIGLPVSFLVDRKGKIAKRYYGPRTYAEFAKDIEGLL